MVMKMQNRKFILIEGGLKTPRFGITVLPTLPLIGLVFIALAFVAYWIPDRSQ